MAVCLSIYYVFNSRVGLDSSIAQHAALSINPPFVFRLLIPWVLSHTLPQDLLDLRSTRILIASGFTVASMCLMPLYLARVTGAPVTPELSRRARMMFLIVVIAHYLLPRNFKFYYVYDFPAITFYLIVFLTLTHSRQWGWWLGCLLAALFAANRETIGVAVVHAFAWHAVHTTGAIKVRRAAWIQALPPLILAITGILVVRGVISHTLNIPPQSSFSWMDGDQFRLVANLQRMATKHHHALAALWFGAGALIWLPKRWARFNKTMRALLWASLPVFAFFCVVGNFVELRMFSELVPILAAGLAWPPSEPQVPALSPSSG